MIHAYGFLVFSSEEDFDENLRVWGLNWDGQLRIYGDIINKPASFPAFFKINEEMHIRCPNSAAYWIPCDGKEMADEYERRIANTQKTLNKIYKML